MSGGEQQMLALARALMSSPRILLIDEPSVGLAPILVSRTIEKIKELKDRFELTVLMANGYEPLPKALAKRVEEGVAQFLAASVIDRGGRPA